MATEAKKVLIRTTGEDPPREFQLQLEPGTLVADATEQAGLIGYRLSRPGGAQFEPGESLYDTVADGQKIFAARTDDLSAGT